MIGALTPIVPSVERRLTVPPVPLGAAASALSPVVAWIGEFTLITPVAITLKTPPLPAVTAEVVPPPLKVTGP